MKKPNEKSEVKKTVKSKMSSKKADLLQRLLKNSNSDTTEILTNCDFYNNPLNIPTDVPIMNVGFSGNLDDGFGAGINILAGPSRHFKTLFALKAARAFLDKYEDGIIYFYDSEFGTTKKYFESMGIPEDSVVRTEIEDIEGLQKSIVNQLNCLTKDDDVFFLIDSLGSLASTKEMENLDANKAKNKGKIKVSADMGIRAKEIKGLMRTITPKINSRKFPCFIVAHTYKTIGLFAKTVLGGGEGMMLAPNTVWFISKSIQKDSNNEVESIKFTIKIEKSRLAKEQSYLPIEVEFEKGIKKYSGLCELALGFGIIDKTKQGVKTAYKFKELMVLESNIDEDEGFWKEVFEESNFKKLVEAKYTLGKTDLSGVKFSFETEQPEEIEEDA